MTAQLRELKTDRTQQKEELLAYLEHLIKEVEDDRVTSLAAVIDYGDGVQFEVKGDVDDVSAIGMLEVAKHGFTMGFFCTHED